MLSMKQKSARLLPKTKAVIKAYVENAQNSTDVLGSYTGRPVEDLKSTPVQDADDL